MNIAHIEEQSYIYGPGCRFVVWTQGCSIHCSGCWNREMWDFTPRRVLSPREVLRLVHAVYPAVEGVTLLGGEPLDQFDDVFAFASLCKESGFSVVLFTGYELPEIEAKGMAGILDVTDILISGRYDESKRTLNHQWIGSTNQELRFLSPRYADYKIEDANYVEVDIDESGALTILGFPGKDIQEALWR